MKETASNPTNEKRSLSEPSEIIYFLESARDICDYRATYNVPKTEAETEGVLQSIKLQIENALNRYNTVYENL